MNRLILTAFALFSLTACSTEKGSILAPTDFTQDASRSLQDAPGALRPLTVAPWTGTTTATGLGESGTLSATFAFAGDVITADLTWTAGGSPLAYHGHVTGTIGALTITAVEVTKCTYTAQGALSADGLHLSGTYQGAGPGVCPQKTGTFQLSRQPDRLACAAGPYAYDGANPFELANSGDATELAYVNAHVSPGPFSGPNKTELTGTSWTSDGAYAVLLVKSAQSYALYTNVSPGQVIVSPSSNKQGALQGISHISTFACVAVAQ